METNITIMLDFFVTSYLEMGDALVESDGSCLNLMLPFQKTDLRYENVKCVIESFLYYILHTYLYEQSENFTS